MREIKFRAWSKSAKIMHPEWKKTDNEGGEYVLMQYTGLNDKNGKEIYEGDVVKSGNGRIWTVNFGNFMYTEPRQTCEGYGLYIQPIENDLKEKGNAYLIHGNFEIIGNVFKNPELLTN